MKLNNGIIYTTENCIGCNKCLSVCPVLGANVAERKVSGNVILVDGNKCIACGSCIKACEHNARKYRDDTDKFLQDIEIEDSNISVIVSSSFANHYPDKYKKVLGVLKTKGVKNIICGDFGGRISLWALLEFIKDNNNNGFISQNCPVVINYICKHKPELISKIMPVHSPIMSAAIYLKKYKNMDTKFAYIGPCIARKDEIDDESTFGYISYNVTYKNIMKEIEKYDLDQFDDVEPEFIMPGSMLFQTPGGMTDLFEHVFDEDTYTRQVNGVNNIFSYIDDYKKSIIERKQIPDFADITACTCGCEYGPGSSYFNNSNDERLLMLANKERSKLVNNKHSLYYKYGKIEKNVKELELTFRKLDLKDFLRNYSQGKFVYEKLVSNEEIDNVFKDMGKETLHDKTINCGACGYKSCRDMANAIARGYNHKSNCLYSVKDDLFNEKKELTKVIVKMNDAKEEVERVNQAKTDFLAKMSHEIRTPINVITGLTEILLDEEKDEELRGYAVDIKNASNGLLSLINDILDLTKIEAGKISIQNADYEIETLINDVVNIMKVPIENKGLKFNISVSQDISSILYGDMARIRQILINILNNACKFTDEGYISLDVTSTRQDDYEMLKFEITDTGIGISKNDYDKLFSEFEQIQNSKSKKTEGTGLGLPISKNLANLMDGDITVESEVGKGSKFTVTIMNKIVKENGTLEVDKTKQILDLEAKNFGFTIEKAKVLVVDDNDINLKVMCRILKKYGIDAQTAVNGLDAIEVIKRDNFDLVFMDQMMPEMDGVEATQSVRAFEEKYYKELPIVALTANAVVGNREELLESGFSDFLSKPVDIKQLEKTLKRWLNSKIVSDEAREQYNELIMSKRMEFEEKFEKIQQDLSVDVLLGITRCAGSEDIYLDVIETFYESGKKQLLSIKELYESKQFIDYKIAVHGVKSAAANIGAMKLSELAKKQEFAVKEENISELENSYPDFLKEFDNVLELLSPYAIGKKIIYDAQGKMSIDKDDIIRSLHQTDSCLNASNVLKAVSELDKILKFSYFDGRVLELANQARNILAFEFNIIKGKKKLEEALSLIESDN